MGLLGIHIALIAYDTCCDALDALNTNKASLPLPK